jgi:hypothetical protein
MTAADRIVRRILLTVDDPEQQRRAWRAARAQSVHELSCPPFVICVYPDDSAALLDTAAAKVWGWASAPLEDTSPAGLIAWMLENEWPEVREAAITRLSELPAAGPDAEVG